MGNGRPNPGLIPSIDDALRRLSDREVQILVYGGQILADGRLEKGQRRLADVFLALRNAAADEADRRKLVEHEIAEDLDGTPEIGGILGPDDIIDWPSDE